MNKFLKNIETEKVLHLEEQVHYLDGQVVSKTLIQNDAHGITLFAFDKGEQISSHHSEGDAIILCLDGEGSIELNGVCHTLKTGESIVMPAQSPHAVSATERFKMMLLVYFE